MYIYYKSSKDVSFADLYCEASEFCLPEDGVILAKDGWGVPTRIGLLECEYETTRPNEGACRIARYTIVADVGRRMVGGFHDVILSSSNPSQLCRFSG